MSIFHPLHTAVQPPERLNSPFNYEPHPLVRLAADEVRAHLATLPSWADEVADGKMFGVLVCSNGEGQLGFLAAYSGQLGGRADWPWFVPAVFDYLQPNGHFKQEEARISAINRRVEELTSEVGRHTTGGDADVVRSLKQERRQRSIALQGWLFDQFQMLSAEGCQRSLTDIFSTTPHHVPPSGAGECCAPKLFQYAFAHHLQPLCIGEFWQGASPRMELRRHGHFYTACRGKCKPILEWMLRGIELEEKTGPEPPASAYAGTTPASSGAGNGTAADLASATGWKVYADNDIVVVNKPSGLLSVPGRTGAPSVESLLNKEYGHVYMPHRLDMDTSGLMVAARTIQAYHSLQLQFLQRTVSKTYVALVERTEWTDGSGTISLPLRPDLLDRPRQVADCEHGKPAVTHWRVLERYGYTTLVECRLETGRTHQIRAHMRHLGHPLFADERYGGTEILRGERSSSYKAFIQNCFKLCPRQVLHAQTLGFRHPTTGLQMDFTSPLPDDMQAVIEKWRGRLSASKPV